MKRQDFKPCALCGKGVAHTGMPLFWRVHIERMGIDSKAAQRHHGIEQFFGGSTPGAVALADVFSDGAPLAKPLTEVQVLVCEQCATEQSRPLAVLAESGI